MEVTFQHCLFPQQPLLGYLKPTDLFKIKVTSTLHYFSTRVDPNLSPPLPLFQTTITFPCKSVFHGDGHQDFLSKYLPYYCASRLTYYNPQSLEFLSLHIIPELQQLFHQHTRVSNNNNNLGFKSKTSSYDSELNVFHLELDIIVKVPVPAEYLNDEEEYLNEEELHMIIQDDNNVIINMVPASIKAIESLKTYMLPEQCNICMEKYHGEDGGGDNQEGVKITAMPCGHLFHNQCIVKWLKSSRTCPMCRTTLST